MADTGSAVALCSVTTIIGYSTLLLASNRALRSFGLAADIGEVTCLFSALILLPLFARIFLRRKAPNQARAGLALTAKFASLAST